MLLKGVNDLELIHYGSNHYNDKLFKPIKNQNWVKPSGGLWTSPIDSKWGWKDWCESENFHTNSLNKMFKLKFKPDSKVIVIDSLEDLKSLPTQSNQLYLFQKYLDFEKLSLVADAIWLTEKGQSETRLSYDINLYGWDCESVLIMNKNCFKYGL